METHGRMLSVNEYSDRNIHRHRHNILKPKQLSLIYYNVKLAATNRCLSTTSRHSLEIGLKLIVHENVNIMQFNRFLERAQ